MLRCEEKYSELFSSGYFNLMDKNLCRFICQREVALNEKSSDEILSLELAVLNLSRLSREGHVCFFLNQDLNVDDFLDEDLNITIEYPDLNIWKKHLQGFEVVGTYRDYKPLILENNRLYFQRYFIYEQLVAQRLKSLSTEYIDGVDKSLLKEGLSRFFEGSEKSNEDWVDWQKIAAMNSILKKLSIITGGPGTGKTTTVVKILLLLLDQFQDKNFSVALCAPTGKAAAHMENSVKGALQWVTEKFPSYGEKFEKYIRVENYTIHRMLKTIHGTPHFKHNRDNPIPFKVIIVDETSMVALPLMARLIDAVPSNSRLIMLGDKDQLSSVEAGAVLGDICDHGVQKPYSIELAEDGKTMADEKIPDNMIHGDLIRGMQGSIVYFTESHRFKSSSGIGNLARLVNNSEPEKAMEFLLSDNYKDIGWNNLTSDLKRNIKKIILGKNIYNSHVSGYKDYCNSLKEGEPLKVFNAFKQFQVLSPLRKGPYGIEFINKLIENLLYEEELLFSTKGFYHGRPVIVNENDYGLKLYNGDIGITMKDETGKLMVYFEDENKEKSSEVRYRKVNPQQLKNIDTVFAMTIHKSQGSEYDNILMVMPAKMSKILTRELIYTGLTRGKKYVEIVSNKDVFHKGCNSRIIRDSGLKDKLWS